MVFISFFLISQISDSRSLSDFDRLLKEKDLKFEDVQRDPVAEFNEDDLEQQGLEGDDDVIELNDDDNVAGTDDSSSDDGVSGKEKILNEMLGSPSEASVDAPDSEYIPSRQPSSSSSTSSSSGYVQDFARVSKTKTGVMRDRSEKPVEVARDVTKSLLVSDNESDTASTPEPIPEPDPLMPFAEGSMVALDEYLKDNILWSFTSRTVHPVALRLERMIAFWEQLSFLKVCFGFLP